MDALKKWFLEQKDKAKAAWSIIVVLAALFGYSVTATPVKTDNILEKLDVIEYNLNELHKAQEVKKTLSIEQLKQEAETADSKYKEHYKNLLEKL